MPKSEDRVNATGAIRFSGFGFLSGFGFRVSDFAHARRGRRIPQYPPLHHRPTAIMSLARLLGRGVLCTLILILLGTRSAWAHGIPGVGSTNVFPAPTNSGRVAV